MDLTGFPNVLEKNLTLGAFVHGGMKRVAKRTLQHLDLTKYLVAFTKYDDSQDEFVFIFIDQGGSIKMKSDPHNHSVGKCSMVAFGDFKGGEL